MGSYYTVTLFVVDGDLDRVEWCVETEAKHAIDAIDEALYMCDETIVGFDSVRQMNY